MSHHRVVLAVLATLFTAGISSAASAGCCGWESLRPRSLYAPVTYASGCGHCGTPTAAVVYAQPVRARTCRLRRMGWLRPLRRRLCQLRTGSRGDRHRAGADLRGQPGSGLHRSRHHDAVSHLDAVGLVCRAGSYPYRSGYGYGYHRYGYAHRAVLAPSATASATATACAGATSDRATSSIAAASMAGR